VKKPRLVTPWGRPAGGGAWLSSVMGGQEVTLGSRLRDVVQWWRIDRSGTWRGVVP
jgi:hypothetical protein